MNPIKVIIAGIIKKDDKFLIAQRSKQDANYGKWEFPGGKIEGNESDEQCLKRELREELSIEAQIGNYACSSFFEQNGIDYELKAYYVTSFLGCLTLIEHQQMKWVTKEEFHLFEFPAPDLPIIEYLINKVPVTFFSALKGQIFKFLRLAFAGGISAFITYHASLYFEYREPIHITSENVQLFTFFSIGYILFGAFMNYYWQD